MNSFIDDHFFLILAVLLILVLVAMTFVLHKLWKWHVVGKAIVLSFSAFTFFHIWTAIWPTDSWYLEDFETRTSIQLSENVKVLYKRATFPDFQGDYFSTAILAFTDAEFSSISLHIESMLEKMDCYQDSGLATLQ